MGQPNAPFDLPLPFPVLHPFAREHVAGALGLTSEQLDDLRFGGAVLVEDALAEPGLGFVSAEARSESDPGERSWLFGSEAIVRALRARGLDTERWELTSLFVPDLAKAPWHGLRYLYARVSHRIDFFDRVALDPRPMHVHGDVERMIEALFANGRGGRIFSCRTDASELDTLHVLGPDEAAQLPRGLPPAEICTSLSDVLAHLEPGLDLASLVVSGSTVPASQLARRDVTLPIVRAFGLAVRDD